MVNRYKKIKNIYLKIYKENSDSICSQINNSKVYFNNHGINHLIRKNGRPREYNQLAVRISLLKYCKEILLSRESLVEKRIEVSCGKKIMYWGLTKNINPNLAVTVVIRKVGNGRVHFYSIFKK